MRRNGRAPEKRKEKRVARERGRSGARGARGVEAAGEKKERGRRNENDRATERGRAARGSPLSAPRRARGGVYLRGAIRGGVARVRSRPGIRRRKYAKVATAALPRRSAKPTFDRRVRRPSSDRRRVATSRIYPLGGANAARPSATSLRPAAVRSTRRSHRFGAPSGRHRSADVTASARTRFETGWDLDATPLRTETATSFRRAEVAPPGRRRRRFEREETRLRRVGSTRKRILSPRRTKENFFLNARKCGCRASARRVSRLCH